MEGEGRGRFPNDFSLFIYGKGNRSRRGRKDIDKMPANNVSSLRLPSERDGK